MIEKNLPAPTTRRLHVAVAHWDPDGQDRRFWLSSNVFNRKLVKRLVPRRAQHKRGRAHR
jgi:hypothetical protein